MGSVFFAVILTSLMTSMQMGVLQGMIDSTVGSYSGYAQIHANGYWDDPIIDNLFAQSDELEEQVESHKLLRGFSPRLESFALAISDSISKGSLVVGIDPDSEAEFNQLNERISSGEYLEANDRSVLIGDGLAEYLQLEVGDTLIMLGQGYHGVNAAGLFPVKGIVKFGSPDLSKQLVFMSLPEMQYLYAADNMYSSLVLHVKNPDDAEQVVADLKQVVAEDYEVMDWKELTPDLVTIIETETREGYVFMFILFLVVGFGIFGTMLMMLAERKREFGVLVAVGMKRVKLSIMVWMEIISMSIMGAIVGILGAYPVSYYFYINPIEFGEEMADIYEQYGIEAVLRASVDPGIFIQKGIIVAVIACIIAIYPFLNLLRLNAINAMRS